MSLLLCFLSTVTASPTLCFSFSPFPEARNHKRVFILQIWQAVLLSRSSSSYPCLLEKTYDQTLYALRPSL